ncbi:Bestrophin [Cooperia oncophora]
MLGFYVSAVFTRWWQIFDNIGWIDTPALWIAQYVLGKTERARLLRRTLVRYLVLTQAIVFRDVSAGVRKRFPTMNHLVTSGLMTEKELEDFNSIVTTYPKYWVVMNWVFRLIRLAREEKNIPGEMVYVDLMEKIRQYRVQVLSLTLYDWVPVPLVYTQVVHLAVRCYFMVALFGRQYLLPDPVRERNIDSAKTVLTLLLLFGEGASEMRYRAVIECRMFVKRVSRPQILSLNMRRKCKAF